MGCLDDDQDNVPRLNGSRCMFEGLWVLLQCWHKDFQNRHIWDLFMLALALRFKCCYWRTNNRLVSMFSDLNLDKMTCYLNLWLDFRFWRSHKLKKLPPCQVHITLTYESEIESKIPSSLARPWLQFSY
jgi:hypothetical protein